MNIAGLVLAGGNLPGMEAKNYLPTIKDFPLSCVVLSH